MGMPDARSPAPLGWPWSIVPAQCFATNEMACPVPSDVKIRSAAGNPEPPEIDKLQWSGRADESKSAQEL